MHHVMSVTDSMTKNMHTDLCTNHMEHVYKSNKWNASMFCFSSVHRLQTTVRVFRVRITEHV